MSGYKLDGYGEHTSVVSHGESYLQVFAGRFEGPGLYLMDEPEAPLSFQSCLALMSVLADLVASGGQVVCCTHSPILTALTGATILEANKDGLREVQWKDLEMVAHYRTYLTNPNRYLKHLLAE
jgi:predicted ATPase